MTDRILLSKVLKGMKKSQWLKDDYWNKDKTKFCFSGYLIDQTDYESYFYFVGEKNHERITTINDYTKDFEKAKAKAIKLLEKLEEIP